MARFVLKPACEPVPDGLAFEPILLALQRCDRLSYSLAFGTKALSEKYCPWKLSGM